MARLAATETPWFGLMTGRDLMSIEGIETIETIEGIGVIDAGTGGPSGPTDDNGAY